MTRPAIIDESLAMMADGLMPNADEQARLRAYIEALERDAASQAERPHAYLMAKLSMVMPLFEEARDALAAITETQRRLYGISATLADRMDAAGTYSVADWRADSHLQGDRNG